MRLKWKLLILAACLIAILGAVAVAEENMLINANIDAVNQSGLADSWTVDMWYRDQGITQTSVAQGLNGNCLYIENLDENDARFKQTVSVEPNTVYEISCMVRAEGCDSGKSAAGLSIENTLISSELFSDTQGEWKMATLYGVTGQNQYELTVMARIGGYGSLNVGRAWFDDFSMTKIDAAPAGVNVKSFATISPEADEEEPVDIPVSFDFEGMWSLFVALMYVVVCVFALKLRTRDRLRGEYQKGSVAKAVCVSLGLALAFRMIIAVTVRGYGVDMNCFIGWATRMADVGPAAFYNTDAFCDYPPGYMYALWLIGKTAGIFNVSSNSAVMWLMVKFIPIAIDVATAYVIYRVGKLAMDDDASAIIAILFAFNPASIIDNAAWGQMDSVLIMLIVISMLYAAKGKWLISLPVYAVAVLVKPQALLFAPLGLVMLIVEIVLSDRKWRMTARILGGIAIAVVVFLGLMYPFTMSMPDGMLPKTLVYQAFGYDITFYLSGFMRQVGWLVNQYAKTLSSYNYITINACNLYVLLDMNWVGVDQTPALYVFSWVMMFASIVYAAFIYIKSRDRAKIFVTAAIMLATLFAFAPKMHERYLLPAMAFTVIAFIYDRDVRLLAAFMAMSFTMTVNTALVLQNEHLIDPQRIVNAVVSIVNVLNAVFMAWIGWDMCVKKNVITVTKKYVKIAPKRLQVERAGSEIQQSIIRPRDSRLNLKRRDFIIMIVLTVAYALVAFLNLGDTKAPQTQWKSTAPGEELTFDLGKSSRFKIVYFGGICDSTFLVQFSDDAETWTPSHYAKYDAGQMYTWLTYSPYERDEDGELYPLDNSGDKNYVSRYVKLTCERAGLTLNEVAFLDEAGKPLPVESVYNYGGSVTHLYDPKALVDEQDAVPEKASYLNGMYFDEIYHARTAYEHLHGMHALEYTHPPLGKVLIMLGIEIFGMTPFGWRFMGALFGVLMIPLMYLMAKQLFKRSSFATLAAFLMLVDGMHFTQTRIATIDVFVVFFIMLMYLFMFRYAMMSFYHVKLYKTLIPLGLCGISMGLAIASKWIGIYGGAGLAIIFFYTVYRRTREYLFAKRFGQSLDIDGRRASQRVVKLYWKNLISTLLFCVVFFIIIPALIYYFSYYWHLMPDGGLSVEGVWNVQKSMYSYHSNLKATHDFASPWYEWFLMLKPIWYYSGGDNVPNNMVSTISCMGNIVVWWGGLVCLIIMLVRFIAIARTDRRYLLVSIGYFAQLIPWIVVTRCTFIYHYFACVPFLILATVAVFECMRKANVKAYRVVASAYCVLALAFFAAFYPIMSGLPVLRSYANNLKWFNWYLFY